MGNPKRQIGPFNFTSDEDHPQFVSAVARGFSILRCFDHGEQYLGNLEIARRTGLPKPTVSRLTFTLSTLGYLSYSRAQEKYALGTAVLSLGHAYLQCNPVVAIARPLMQELAEHSGASVMLAAPDGMRMVLLATCHAAAVRCQLREAGLRVPHSTTALGRADLAARPAELFERELAELRKDCQPASWPRVRDSILRARQEYEQLGFCLSLGDWNPKFFAVGVPMVSADGERILAFNCSGPLEVVTRERLLQDLGPRLVALRDQVHAITGGRF